MALGILGSQLGSRPPARIDLGPECVPGFPCSAAAEERQILERGLTAFRDRSRRMPDPFAETGVDPELLAYQSAIQDLSHRNPAYAAALAREASNLARLSSGSLARRARLTRSPALQGPYYIVPMPPATLYDAAWTGVPLRVVQQRQGRIR